ncbi:MAG TPA: ELWxxDGT repeat protein [Herpetosiphonaceae bacterium]
MRTHASFRLRRGWLCCLLGVLSVLGGLRPSVAAPQTAPPITATRLTALPNGGIAEDPLVVAHGRVYFGGPNGATGALWASDGTPAGTVMIKSLPGWWPTAFEVMGPAVYFIATTATNSLQYALWRTDGTAAGTVMIKTISPAGTYGAVPTVLVEVHDLLWFYAPRQPDQSSALWRSDGTPEGTFPVFADPGPNYHGYGTSPIVAALGDAVYFAANHSTFGIELWRTDGTPAGTRLVTDLWPGPDSSQPAALTVLGNHLYFQARHPDTGAELWRTDGTAAGTVLASDTWPGSANGWSYPFTVWNGVLYFSANAGPTAYGLWRTDGTSAGTRPVLDPPENLVAGLLTPWNGHLAMLRSPETPTAPSLWQTDGTARGTQQVLPTQGITMTNLTVIDRQLLVTATDAATGSELWMGPGTTGTLERLTDIAPGAAGSAPMHITALGDSILFTAKDGTTGRQLWRIPRSALPPSYTTYVPVLTRRR